MMNEIKRNRKARAKELTNARRNMVKAREKFFNSGDSLDAIDFLLRQDNLSNVYGNDMEMGWF